MITQIYEDAVRPYAISSGSTRVTLNKFPTLTCFVTFYQALDSGSSFAFISPWCSPESCAGPQAVYSCLFNQGERSKTVCRGSREVPAGPAFTTKEQLPLRQMDQIVPGTSYIGALLVQSLQGCRPVGPWVTA